VADTPRTFERKRDYYLQLMRKAQMLDDQVLVKMILKKLAGLGAAGAVSTAGGCTVIPFPIGRSPADTNSYEPTSWWVLFKLTLAIPGSQVALFLLSVYYFN